MIKIDVESLADLKKYLSYAGQFSIEDSEEKIKIINENKENYILITKTSSNLQILSDAMKQIIFNIDGKRLNINSLLELAKELEIDVKKIENLENINSLELRVIASKLEIENIEIKLDSEIRKNIYDKLIAFTDSVDYKNSIEKN